MVGGLNLHDVPDPLDVKKKGERVLDSPDSGLPPSPSPANWLLPSAGARAGGGPESSPLSPTPGTPRLCLLSFGEGVELDPLPPKEIRYTSSIKYDSDKHFIDNIFLPVGLGISSCSQTVFCVPDCTWRSYRAELHLEPRNRPSRFVSTTIVYPKHPKTIYTTTLDYNCRKSLRRFLCSVELEATDFPSNDCFPDDY